MRIFGHKSAPSRTSYFYVDVISINRPNKPIRSFSLFRMVAKLFFTERETSSVIHELCERRMRVHTCDAMLLGILEIIGQYLIMFLEILLEHPHRER